MASSGIFFQPQHEADDADIIVAGLPWDGTVSNRPGTRFGPGAIRGATLGSEDYSPWLNRDIADIRIHDAGDFDLPHGDTAACMDVIGGEYRRLISHNVPVIALGGEHLVSWPLVQTLHERYGEDLFVLQLDAHADLRDEYLGVRLSHACVMNLVTDLIGFDSTAVIGVRSGDREEWRRLRVHPFYYGGASHRSLADFMNAAQDILDERTVYVTIDLDVFDPGVMPGTGTPEPGGISFREFIDIVRTLGRFNLAGGDIVELSPDYDHSGASQALAATVLREMILIMGKHDEQTA